MGNFVVLDKLIKKKTTEKFNDTNAVNIKVLASDVYYDFKETAQDGTATSKYIKLSDLFKSYLSLVKNLRMIHVGSTKPPVGKEGTYPLWYDTSR